MNVCPRTLALCFWIMKLRLNEHITFDAAAVLENMTDDSRERVRAAVLQQYGRFEDIRLVDFISFANGDFMPYGIDTNKPEEMTVAQYVWLSEFRKFVDLFNKINISVGQE